MKYIFTLLFLLIFSSNVNAEECSLTIDYFGYGDGASEWRIGDTSNATGTLVKHSTIHPSRGEIVQRGIILDTPMCMYDVLRDQPHKPAYRKDSAYTHFIIPQLYDEEVCSGKIEKYYKDNMKIEISVIEIWLGNSNYATSFALIVDNIRMPNEDWLCNE